MSNLTRYDPFSIEPVSDMFQGLFRPLRGLMTAEGDALPDIRIDVSESEGAYEVKADIPGVNKDDIDVRVDGNVVSIGAKVERGKEQREGERVIRRERYSGSIQRSFSLANDIDESKVQARYENGTLALTLPKRTTAGQKKIAIS
jgi:HSP20 family protein